MQSIQPKYPPYLIIDISLHLFENTEWKLKVEEGNNI